MDMQVLKNLAEFGCEGKHIIGYYGVRCKDCPAAKRFHFKGSICAGECCTFTKTDNWNESGKILGKRILMELNLEAWENL